MSEERETARKEKEKKSEIKEEKVYKRTYLFILSIKNI